MQDPSWNEADAFNDRLGDDLMGLLKSELDPTEYLLWADRPELPPPRPIPFVPALFVAVVAGLSGFSLAAMFGFIDQDWIDHRTLIMAFGLAPVVLGGMIVAHLISLGVRRWRKGLLLSRLVYALTDRRVLVARVEPQEGLSATSVRQGDVTDTRRFENPDGSGDLYFLGRGSDQWLPLEFVEVPRVRLVESMVREALLDLDQDWWKLGADLA